MEENLFVKLITKLKYLLHSKCALNEGDILFYSAKGLILSATGNS